MQSQENIPGEAEGLIILDEEDGRQVGVKCIFCGSRKVVYAISKSLGIVWPLGAYCYKCLLTRVTKSRSIPFPIPQDLLDKLKHDSGIGINTPPKYKFRL